MSKCLSVDAIVTIGDALEWEVVDGLRHLETCDECRADLALLRATRHALAATESVDPTVLARVSAAVGSVARAERQGGPAPARWRRFAEPCVAGIAALIVLVSSGVRIQTIGAASLGFVLGAALMMAGNALERRLPVLGDSGAHA